MWLGGRNYFRNLLIAVSQLPDPQIEPVVFAGKRDASALEDLPAVNSVRTGMMDRGRLPWLARKLLARAAGDDRMLQRLMTKQRIDVISHSGPLVRGSRIATVAWIPDFQHVHLPGLFTDEERQVRDRYFMDLCSRSDEIIVSSRSALLDLESFAPQYAQKAHVLHFVASHTQSGANLPLPALQRKYKFAGPFFLLPNQFWEHKNHRLVIDALALLKLRGQTVLVLATGGARDHRNPKFFESLMKHAELHGVTEQFRVLGVIPFADLSGLMTSAVALINPSHFEGWSTSVEEAKSAGKCILLSDIPVHREQAPARGVYFPADDAEGLAQALMKTLKEYDPRVESQHRNDAVEKLQGRQVEFARAYQGIVLAARFSKHQDADGPGKSSA
jgi:glycosyltransferase involved in cell wall biosynthesis